MDKNEGTFRRHIWDYLFKNRQESVEYSDFLLSMQRLVAEGKMLNDLGRYSVEMHTYAEIMEQNLGKSTSVTNSKQPQGIGLQN